MKKIICLLLFVFSLTTFAAVEIKFTSFYRVSDNVRNPTAEICGVVTGMKEFPIYLELVVDEKTNSPGFYQIMATPEGKFCHLVITKAGTILGRVRAAKVIATATL